MTEPGALYLLFIIHSITWRHFVDEETRAKNIDKKITKLLEDKDEVWNVLCLTPPKPCFRSRERWNVSASNQRAAKWKGRVLECQRRESLFGTLRRACFVFCFFVFSPQLHNNSKAYQVAGSKQSTSPALSYLILTTTLNNVHYSHSTDKEPRNQKRSYLVVNFKLWSLRLHFLCSWPVIILWQTWIILSMTS